MNETIPRCVLLTRQSDPDADVTGTSGLSLDQRWILTHGSLLASLSTGATTRDSQLLKAIVIASNKNDDLFAVTDSLTFRVRFSLTNERIAGRSIVEKNCSLRVAWKCSLLYSTLGKMLASSWNFDRVGRIENYYQESLRSLLLLLKIDNDDDNDDDDAILDEARYALRKFYTNNFETATYNLNRGDNVELESAPFANAEFLGSLSRGIISNLLGDHDCVLLSDAIAVPGCEGSPLYVRYSRYKNFDRRIIGMILATTSRCNGERVDYTFAANLRVCLGKVLRMDLTPRPRSLTEFDARHFLPDLLNRSLALIRCGSNWGTGVIIDAPSGIILTCSHVVSLASYHDNSTGNASTVYDITARLSNGTPAGVIEVPVRLVYKSRFAARPYDVAVLKLEKRIENLGTLTIADTVPEIGSRVLIAGYEFSKSLPATWSTGVISRATNCVLQTTCCVQSGSSGGPVIEPGTGRLLGLIVSNVAYSSASSVSGRENDLDTETLYTRFNMAVPANVLRRPLMSYIRTGVVEFLEELTTNDPSVREAWNFYLSPRSKM